jgi:hypothetical protein
MFLKLLIVQLYMLMVGLFDGEGGGDAGGSGEGAPPAAGGANPPAANPPVGGGAPAPAPGEQTIPYSRFKEINDELQRRKDEDQKKADEAAAKAGDFEKVRGRLEGENTGLKETLTLVARRNAFYDVANGKASNLRLAFIAAGEMGLLGDLKVAIDLEKRHADVENRDAIAGIVDKVLRANPELKARSSSFGDPQGGTPPGDGADVDKLSPTQKMEYGYQARQRERAR